VPAVRTTPDDVRPVLAAILALHRESPEDSPEIGAAKVAERVGTHPDDPNTAAAIEWLADAGRIVPVLGTEQRRAIKFRLA
jgi:hypothetical protein